MIGSHNTFTYMSPSRLWMYLFVPFSKCQSSSINKQSSLGVELADIRVRLYKGDWWVCHGPVRYMLFTDAIKVLIVAGIEKVRLLIEGKYGTSDISILEYLIAVKFRTITFYEGRDKKTWKQIIKLPTIDIEQYVGSMQSWYGKLFPFLYHYLNRSVLDKLKEDLETNPSKLGIFDFI